MIIILVIIIGQARAIVNIVKTANNYVFVYMFMYIYAIYIAKKTKRAKLVLKRTQELSGKGPKNLERNS